ncbi:hypothetical protein OESDEN_09562 [Oesophagostomum dentatum]|uniref:Uncharacterized protein n=1 Tax=Oesophagostomum dentatum TaxID=61180 RepID=A0A0B1T373_OESDE|nr:hypothetical protein OESDEN_09562 [Oesophagostomum dentatum]
MSAVFIGGLFIKCTQGAQQKRNQNGIKVLGYHAQELHSLFPLAVHNHNTVNAVARSGIYSYQGVSSHG